MDQIEERTLVAGLIRMDAGAWETLCNTYSLPLRTFVQWRFGCSRDTAEDIVQMAFVRCVKSIGSFDPARGRLFAWLKAVSKNEARTMLSGACVGQAPPDEGRLSDVADEIIEKLDDAILPDELVARQETQLLIHEVMLELSGRQREVLTLKYLEDCSVSEIAVRLGQSEKAIESLLSRSRNAFREVFSKRINTSKTREGEYIDEA